jgi:hypothetical protein
MMIVELTGRPSNIHAGLDVLMTLSTGAFGVVVYRGSAD